MNSKYAYACAGLLLGLTACSNEDLTSPTEVVTGKTVNVTLTVDRSGGKTRTEVGENPGGLSLYSKWAEGDKLLVVNSANTKVGELEIELPINTEVPSKGVFKGQATVDASESYTLVYLGGTNDNGGAYATWTDGKGINNPVATPDATEGFSVSGSIVDLCRADLLVAGVEFDVTGENAYPAADVNLEARNAMSHFTLSGIPTDLDTGATLTVNYGDVASHKIAGIQSELYLPMPTGEYAISFSLTNGSDTYTASVKEGATVTVTPLYYVATDENNQGKGIEVTLKKDKPTGPILKPNDDSDLIGKMFEVNGKKFRFTKGNLKYTVDTKEWSLMDHQYDFICKGGWTLSNGTWSKTKESVIDLFGYGATGLFDIQSGQTANAPTFWKQTAAQSYTNAAYYYPTEVTKWNEGYTGSYLEKGIKFTNFDWGKAYYLSKIGEDVPTSNKPYTSYDWAINPSHKEGDPEPLRYFTLSSDDWEKLQDKYFMCGVTITGITNPVNTAAKNNIYGCLIFPITGEGNNSADINKDKLAKVKALLEGDPDNDIPKRYTYLSTSLTTNLNFTGTNYQYFRYDWLKITKAHFEELEKLGVVFLPEAGHRAVDSLSKTDGYYWTSKNGQANTAVVFRFDGDSDTKVFKLDAQSSRTFGSAVRLVKEVPADYEDPKVVD